MVFRLVALVGLAVLTVVLAGFVVRGMIGGVDPQFDRGVSPISSVVIQEGLGVATLAALALAAWRFPAAARGSRFGVALGWFGVAVLLAGCWFVAFLFERSS